MGVSAVSYSTSLANIASELTQIASELTQVAQELEQSMPTSQAVEGAQNVEMAPIAPTSPITSTAPPSATVTPASSTSAAPTTPAPTNPTPTATAQGTGDPSKLRIASFNVLGDVHVGTGGNQHPTWQKGTQRTPRMIGYLKNANVDVAGLQEFEPTQQKEFEQANTGYSVYATKGSDDAVIWKSSEFTALQKKSVTIKYFDGAKKQVPVVLLQQKSTGKKMWVMSVHNPANTHPGSAGYRATDMQVEKQAMQQLGADGTPVYLVGDFNQTTSAKQAVTGGTQIKAATGVSSNAQIDQIYGLGANLSFSNYSVNHDTQHTQTSDHPIVTATTTLT